MPDIELNIDSDSLLTFCKNRPIDSDNDESESEKYFLWKDLFWFIKSDTCNINLQINEKDNLEQNPSNPDYSLIRFLLDKYLSSSSNVSIVKNANHIDINKHPFSKLSLTKDNNICTSKSFCINNGSIFTNWNDLRNLKPRTISPKFKDKYTINSWNDLNGLVIPCNSVLICDNYLFSYEASFEDNFSKLINEFLPPNKKIEFHLVIITSVFYGYDKIRKTNTIGLDKIYKRILSILDSKGYNNIITTLVEATIHDTHDRHIYTNYQVLKSGHSFNYFKQDSKVALKQSTTLDIISLIAKNDKGIFIDQYMNFITYCKNILDNASDNNIIGAKRSRFFKK